MTLVVNDLYRKEIKIIAKVERPELTLLEKHLDFGKLELGLVYSKTFIVENKNAVIVDWEIWETFMKNGGFTKSSNSMVFDNLDDGNIEVEYIVRATEVGEFSSTLQLITKYKDESVINGVCTVSYIVDDLTIYLHTQMSECSILCPGELLYANKTSVYTLCLHNVSQIDANFLFGEIYGDKSDLVCAKVFPTTGFVPAKTFKRVNLELTPLEVCVFESLYLPCEIITYNPSIKGKYVEKKPLVLVILCVVEDVNVQLIIPGMEKPVYWPPQMNYDLEYRIEPEKCVNESKSSSEVEEAKVFSKTDFAEESVINDITEYLHNLIQGIGEEEVEPIKREDTISTSSFSALSSDSLREYFDEDIFIHENHMEFKGVPLRAPIKKTIAIQNMTPVEGFLEVDVANFKPVLLTTRSIHNILVDLNVKKDDHWESILGNNGVLIKLELGKQHLDPYEGTFLDVWVYANTWGIYADEIQFQVNNIAPLLITVLIEVVGLPLEFPIAKNSLNKHAKFRFGVVPYNSKSVKRKVYVRNTSRVPVSVVWHVFMKTLDCRDKPITLLFDIYHPNMKRLLDADVESTGNLILTHRKLCGFSNYDIFNITPRETFIDVGQTIAIDIVFNSDSYVTQIGRTDIEANLVGYIHVANIFKKRDHMFMRKTGSQMHPLRLKLYASLDTPKLNLDTISDLSFAIHASIEVDKESISASKVLIFKNHNNFPMEVSFSIGDPFKIQEIQYLDNFIADVKSPITILPESCVYLKVCFKLVLDQLYNMANLIYNLARHDEYQVYSVNFGTCSYKYFNELKIMQKGAMKQIIPAELEIYFPLIEIPTLLDFGIVFIGNSRKMTLTIKNYTNCRVPFEIISDGEFIVTQTSGVLGSCMNDEPFIYDIYVICIPCEYKLYEAEMTVKTNVDFCQYSTKLRAIGSHNEKQFKLNTC
ncbi:PREDICTED: uncharacterized protein LOC108565594 [Nicrophorus vespilloides]|uniref:Uncharacterized protein LOC108565594 n=1 Tax=Nicrophorus vespilloides TaxID=110193 RepID=A0ABM1N1C4_NICVS|nr:PREDICTED: uncharacterized protein LOC108565594 [Nicrophorus vespilloides]